QGGAAGSGAAQAEPGMDPQAALNDLRRGLERDSGRRDEQRASELAAMAQSGDSGAGERLGGGTPSAGATEQPGTGAATESAGEGDSAGAQQHGDASGQRESDIAPPSPQEAQFVRD